MNSSRAREALASSDNNGSDSKSLDYQLSAALTQDSNSWVYGFELKAMARLQPSTDSGSRAGRGHTDKDNKCKGPADIGYGGERTSGRKARVAEEQNRFSPYSSTADVLGVSSSLKHLDTIYVIGMESGRANHGCILFGTICKPPEVVNGMLQMRIKDQFGEEVVAIMHFSLPNAMDMKEVFTEGKFVAIKHPCLQHTSDGTKRHISVWKSCDSIEIVGKLPRISPNTLLDDAKMHAIDGKWDLALQGLTRCIEVAKSEIIAFDKANGKVLELRNILVECYSTRAKVFYNTHCFEEAAYECNEALKIDPYHCKSLYRKALAYERLFRFEEACACLEDACIRNRGQGKTKRKKKIKAILRSCRNCCSQNQNGEYADLARYLLHTYNPTVSGSELPSFANHVGHVQVKLLRKSKARGLFASRDIKAGDVLMVSNAMAICYQTEGYRNNVSAYDSAREKLICKVEGMEKLHLALSYLSGSGCTNTSCTSELIALAESDLLPNNDKALSLNNNCTKEIVRLNAFGPHHFCQLLARHEYASKFVDAKSYLGLWFLPSFINHSCVSNASRLVVGEAMFVHAARDIDEGDEITLPYIDTLVPLKQRRYAMKRWGFCCACKRCTFEQTMQAPLSKVIKKYDAVSEWIVKSIEEAFAAKSLTGFVDQSFKFSTRSDYEDISLELGEVMTFSRINNFDEEKSRWMMASYSVLLWFKSLPLLRRDLSDPGLASILGNLLEAIICTAPGHLRALVLVGNVNGVLRQGALEGPAYAVGKSVFGAQEPHVLAELVRLYGSVMAFP
ncbi:hypothetical protein L7F22_007427 [Adiantum nelumboides]|nr:hypothetical protein [Adiantum nelumboides]